MNPLCTTRLNSKSYSPAIPWTCRILKALKEAGFSDNECSAVSESLRRLTNRIVHHEDGLWRKDASKLDTLISRREKLLGSDMESLERVYWSA